MLEINSLMWTTFHGFATEQTQLRGKNISELEDMQNEKQIEKKRKGHPRAKGQYQTI